MRLGEKPSKALLNHEEHEGLEEHEEDEKTEALKTM
jgi:hypothetical protein